MHPVRWAKSTGHGDWDIRWQDSRTDCTNSSHVGPHGRPFARRPRPIIQSPSRANRVRRSSPGRPSKSSASISRRTTRPPSIAGTQTSRSSSNAPLGNRHLIHSLPRGTSSRRSHVAPTSVIPALAAGISTIPALTCAHNKTKHLQPTQGWRKRPSGTTDAIP